MKKNQTSTERQEAITKLVKNYPISDQKQLVDLLHKHYQIETNQTVISRDLRKLGIMKKMVDNVLIYNLSELNEFSMRLRWAIIDINLNETMIVIKTQPALADFVGDWIDQYPDLDVLGCLGGENVVFVIPKSIKNITHTYNMICEKCNFIQSIKVNIPQATNAKKTGNNHV